MRGNIQLRIASVLALVLSLSSLVRGEDLRQPFFDTTDTKTVSVDSILSLNDVLALVGTENGVFRSFNFQLQAAKSNLRQAGLWANPELSVEYEEVGWDSPGFKESELTVSLSQEFEFFGQRSARKNVATAEIEATRLRLKQSAFDLYLETKQRYYTLAHAQQEVVLAQASVALVEEIVENITHRLDRGAALQSELLLARLEAQRSRLALDQARQDVLAVEVSLVSLWNGTPSGLRIVPNAEPDFARVYNWVLLISDQIDSTRDAKQLQSRRVLLNAERGLAAKDAMPNLTFSGGFRRAQVSDSKSFLLGVSLPIPFLNRNQGVRESITAQLRSLEFDLERSTNEVRANIRSQTIRIKQLTDKHAALDSLLLPTAKKVYETLYQTYEAGRVPYTQLLEAERYLNELSFEHNDVLLAVQEQIVALEQLTGLALRVDWEN